MSTDLRSTDLSARANESLRDIGWGSDHRRPVVTPDQGHVILATPAAFLGGVAVASATVAAFEAGMD